MNAALRADPDALQVNLTVPTTTVRLGPIAFDGLKALLGIDIGDLDHVLQVGCPSTVAAFLQRMGRSGRRPGTRANFTFLTLSDELTSKEPSMSVISVIKRPFRPSTPPDLRLPAWTSGDTNAAFGLGFNVLVNVLVLSSLCIGVLGLSQGNVYGTIVPALGIIFNFIHSFADQWYCIRNW